LFITIDVLADQITTKGFYLKLPEKAKTLMGMHIVDFIEAKQYFFQKNTCINQTNKLPEKSGCTV